MNVLFFREYPFLDGSLTWKMRLASKLKSKGFSVSFLFVLMPEEQLLKTIASIGPVYWLNDLQNKPEAYFFLQQTDVVHAGVNGDWLFKIFDLRKKYFSGAAIAFGAWASDAFVEKSKIGWSPNGQLYKQFLQNIPSVNITFGSKGIKEKHEGFSGRNFSQSPVMTNSYELPGSFLKTGSDKRILISVSRLSPSKEYIFAVIKVLKILHSFYPDFIFKIVGNGVYKDKLVELVESLNLNENVIFTGELDGPKVEEALRSASLFIGMGGAIIEAAALGLPSIQAIEYVEEPLVYGWFHDLHDGEVGDYRADKNKIPLLDILKQYLAFSPEQYQEACQKSFLKAQEFNIDVIIEDYINFLKKADRNFAFVLPWWKKKLIKVLRQPFKLIPAKREKTIGR